MKRIVNVLIPMLVLQTVMSILVSVWLVVLRMTQLGPQVLLRVI